MWSSVTIDQAFLLWNDDMVHRLRAWQVLDGEKPGLIVINPAMLSHAWPRQRFIDEHGFDPLGGMAAPGATAGAQRAMGADLSERVAERINEHSALPVIVFDAAGMSVRMLRKPEAP